MCLSKSGIAQSPSFDVYIANEKYISSKVFQFEIWFKKTGKGKLEIANLQFAILVDSAFRSGGTITPSFVEGSSMFIGREIPTPAQIIYTKNTYKLPDKDMISISGRNNPGCGSGTIISDTGSCASPGTRFMTIQLTTDLPRWHAGVRPNLDFSTAATSFRTKISYYPQPCPSTGTDATPQGTFYDYNAVPNVVCPGNPPAPARD